MGGSGARLFTAFGSIVSVQNRQYSPSNIDPIANLTSTSQTTLQRPSLAPGRIRD